MPLSPCLVYPGRDYLQSSLFDALVSSGVPSFIWFCLPKPAAIADKTVEGPGFANYLSNPRFRREDAPPRHMNSGSGPAAHARQPKRRSNKQRTPTTQLAGEPDFA
jgi:hypothetical protein